MTRNLTTTHSSHSAQADRNRPPPGAPEKRVFLVEFKSMARPGQVSFATDSFCNALVDTFANAFKMRSQPRLRFCLCQLGRQESEVASNLEFAAFRQIPGCSRLLELRAEEIAPGRPHGMGMVRNPQRHRA